MPEPYDEVDPDDLPDFDGYIDPDDPEACERALMAVAELREAAGA